MVLKTKRILSLTLAVAMIATAPNQIPAQENDIKTQAVSPETVEKVLPEGFTGVTAEIKGAWNKIDEEVLANGNANYPADEAISQHSKFVLMKITQYQRQLMREKLFRLCMTWI